MIFVPVLQDVAKKTTSSVVEVQKNGGGCGGVGAFQPFQKEKIPLKTEAAAIVGKKVGSSPVPEATTSSTAETASKGSGGTSKREDKESQTHRKQRRCWSSELHRRFVHALQQLGGPHGTSNNFIFILIFSEKGFILIIYLLLFFVITVATPKQIRELMKVDGLTNDEVKSHLQVHITINLK